MTLKDLNFERVAHVKYKNGSETIFEAIHLPLKFYMSQYRSTTKYQIEKDGQESEWMNKQEFITKIADL